MIFSGILGHETQKSILNRALAGNRIAHAYLFTGPEGVGKQLLAVALARAIFCQDGTGCGECPSCRKVEHRNHPDLHLIEPDGSSIKIDQIRALQRELAFRPLEGSRKICIIDHADRMNPAAGNALLKTLEEPSGDALLILLSARPEAVLQTIRSRCQSLPFQRLSTDLIRDALLRATPDQPAQAGILAALSDGSFHRALGRDRDLFVVERVKILKTVTALLRNSVIPLFDLAAELAAEKENASDLLDILSCFYRDLLYYRHGWPIEELVNSDLPEKIRRTAGQLTPEMMIERLEAIEAARYQLERNVNRELVFDLLLLRLAIPA